MRRKIKEYKNECIAQINQLGQVYGQWEVFSDFIHMLIAPVFVLYCFMLGQWIS